MAMTIETGSAHINLTCYAFHVWAEDFLSAARTYAPTARPAAFVAHFLCCQSIELSLKAYLSLRGVSRKDLQKKYGHSLVRLFRDASDMGIGKLVTLATSDAKTIERAAAWYHSKDGKRFQYVEMADVLKAFKNAPELALLEDIASRLQASRLRETVLRES